MNPQRLLTRLLLALTLCATASCTSTGGECGSGTFNHPSCYQPDTVSPALAAHCQGESGYTRLECSDGSVGAIPGWPTSTPCQVISFERRCAPGDVRRGMQLVAADPCGGAGTGGAGTGGAGTGGTGGAGAAGSEGAACLRLPALEGSNSSTTQQLFECLGQRPGTGASEVLTEDRKSGALRCCYDFTSPILCGEGRPLWVAGERVAAALVSRTGWA